jgi:UDP-N-acetyl-2-amino-2-deoxyglucuronate dehydrogenase
MFKAVNGRKIRVGVVGCGRISKNHFGSIEAHSENMEVGAVCDIDPVRLAEHEQKYGVKGYARMEDMLSNESIDLVALCTPSGLHPDQAVLAASYGVNVVTEKPMATRWQDGVRMVKACDDARVRLFVVKQNRRNTTLQMLKRAFDEKRFGKVYMVNINVFWTRPQEYYDAAKWRGTWELDGGAFMNQASHYVDLVDWLVGPVESVHAMTATLERNIEVEDSGVLNIRWRSGALGSMCVTMLTYPKNLEGSITILGEKGTVRIGGVCGQRYPDLGFPG